MRPIVLQTVARVMAPVLLVLSVVMLLRGHDLPGGGFIGGLMAAAAFVLLVMAFGVEGVRKAFPFAARKVAALGFMVALGAGLLGWLGGSAFLEGLWTTLELGVLSVKVGTPLLFDLGVYFTVLGATLTFVFNVEGQ